MKTKEELNAIKNEIDTLNKKLAELNEEELKQVTGGSPYAIYMCPRGLHSMEASFCRKCDQIHIDNNGIGTCVYYPGSTI